MKNRNRYQMIQEKENEQKLYKNQLLKLYEPQTMDKKIMYNISKIHMTQSQKIDKSESKYNNARTVVLMSKTKGNSKFFMSQNREET